MVSILDVLKVVVSDHKVDAHNYKVLVGNPSGKSFDFRHCEIIFHAF